MVAMSPANSLTAGARICDPFCGVGGFVLETIVGNPHIYKEFEPHNGQVEPKISLVGLDKGTDEKEDERTIILAKANMLIYFSDLLVKYNTPKHLRAFSEGAFNKVFNLIRSNLGTFGHWDEAPFDLILTNPPYVTSGSSSLKRAIDEEGLSKHYTSKGRGTEALAVEWIIRHLKLGSGNALIIVPDGLLNQKNILEFVKRECVIRAIISLPPRTFYATPKKTYILSLQRKLRPEVSQSEPVFTYLVSEIGETRDAKRFKMKQNDLDQATVLYNQFKGSPKHFASPSPRCKIVSFPEFAQHEHWLVERWWTKQERIALGIEEALPLMSLDEFKEKVRDVSEKINTIQQKIEALK
jgi:type I restriction-modification system DNA methylase subunit